MSSNLKVQGLKTKNSSQFRFRFDSCQNVQIEKFIIISPAQSPKTGGIHFENTNNSLRKVYNSVISNGNSINYLLILYVYQHQQALVVLQARRLEPVVM